MFSRKELKSLAKSQLNGNWDSGVLVTFVYVLLVLVLALVTEFIPYIGDIIYFLIIPPLAIGLIITYIDFVNKKDKLKVSNIFKGYSIYGKSLGISLWIFLWVFLWSLLFIIPGIIKAIAYSLSYYIIAENPNIKVREAVKLSMKMTEGHKWNIFVLGLSFIGWSLLCILTLGIGFLWLTPYINTTYVNLYNNLKESSIEKGILTKDDFAAAQ